MYKDDNNNFYGRISGKNIFDFIKDLDYKLKTTEERIDLVNDRLETYEIEGVEFYHSYFDEVYDQERKYGKIDIVINNSKTTYSESNVARGLEILGSYILNAPDEKEYRKLNDVNYKLYNSKELYNRAIQEEQLIYQLSSVNSDRSNNYEYSSNNDYNDPRKDIDREGSSFAIFQLPKNYKKVKDIIIEPKDFKRFPILQEYQNSIDNLKNRLDNLMEFSKFISSKNDDDFIELIKENKLHKRIIQNNLKSLKIDMLDIKKKLEQPIIWKSPLKDDGFPCWDELDMFDKKHIKELLKVKRGNDLQDDLSCIVMDLNNLLDTIEFTDNQRNVLELYRKGLSITEISNELDLHHSVVNRTLNSILNLIIKAYEEIYTDWYYLNICKGEYKKCSKCGEIKLVSEFNKKGKQGYQPNCKKCRKTT